jgi:hypothetical protein
LKRTCVITGGAGGSGSVWNVVICPRVLGPDRKKEREREKTAYNDIDPPLSEESWSLGGDGGRVKEAGVSGGGGRRGASSNVEGGGVGGTGRGGGGGIGIAGELRLPEEEEEANFNRQ